MPDLSRWAKTEFAALNAQARERWRLKKNRCPRWMQGTILEVWWDYLAREGELEADADPEVNRA